MALVSDVLTRAYGYDDSFVQGSVATESTELVPLVDQLVKKYFARAGRINPRFFGQKLTVAPASSKWTLSAGIVRFWRVETTAGAEVKVVSADQQDAEFAPRVYQVGRDLFTVNASGDPDETTDSLVVFCNRYPTTLSGTGSTVDSEFPDHFYPLLEMGVAQYLASRAGMFDLVTSLGARITALEADFDAAVGSVNAADAMGFAVSA